MEARGYNGTLEFNGKMVVIKRTGLMARLSTGLGEKRIPVRSIAAVQWKEPGIVNGFISFTIPGGVEKQSRFGSQTKSASQDENSIIVTWKQVEGFKEIRDAIEAAISE
ncbi:MAG: DUF4429 domain-containing protein [Actinomycetota bacterium]|nr:DUF4429 domain-containing protein [Actinomycetota bacterium]